MEKKAVKRYPCPKYPTITEYKRSTNPVASRIVLKIGKSSLITLSTALLLSGCSPDMRSTMGNTMSGAPPAPTSPIMEEEIILSSIMAKALSLGIELAPPDEEKPISLNNCDVKVDLCDKEQKIGFSYLAEDDDICYTLNDDNVSIVVLEESGYPVTVYQAADNNFTLCMIDQIDRDSYSLVELQETFQGFVRWLTETGEY